MATGVKQTNVEEVLPNDEDLGRRNCLWRELLGKYEEPVESTENPSDQSMEIDTAMVMLDQEMSNESSVSDVVEASSSEEQSAEENPEEIKQQLRRAVPLRQREWEANGLKEILDDNEFRMVSHEKVENWLRNHMHTITGNYNVHYQTQQVTTVTTETHMDADADSLYSVDTAQYIRSNKQISNKLKVTTMIKQYSVTSSVRRLTSLGIGAEEQHKADAQAARHLSLAARAHSISDGACDANKPIARYYYEPEVQQKAPPLAPHNRPSANKQSKDRPNRRKVFKKTVPRKRPTASGMVERSFDPASPSKSQPSYNQDQMYAKALEQCARMKKNKPSCRRKVSKRVAMRMQTTSTSSSSASDNDEVFFAPVSSSRERPPASSSSTSIRPKAVPQTAKPHAPLSTVPPSPTSGSPRKTSPTEREILEPFQSITLSACDKRQRAKPAGPVCAKLVRPEHDARKRVGIQRDGCYHDEGLIIYRPKAIRPNCPTAERINLRMQDLTLTGVTKQRHLDKFQHFNYNIHPNSTVCFYPSDSSDSPDDAATDAAAASVAKLKHNSSATETSYDDDDPILTFHPRNTKRLNVVEIPFRRRVT